MSSSHAHHLSHHYRIASGHKDDGKSGSVEVVHIGLEGSLGPARAEEEGGEEDGGEEGTEEGEEAEAGLTDAGRWRAQDVCPHFCALPFLPPSLPPSLLPSPPPPLQSDGVYGVGRPMCQWRP
jgi:hypothetical protein